MSRPVNSDLHTLISALSQSERRYVKLFLRRHMAAETNQSEILFDAMAAQAVYDEEALKRRYRTKGFVQRLPEAKRELMTLILRAMRQYHGERTRERAALTALLDAEFLFDRGLYALAHKRAMEARDMAAAIFDHALRAKALLSASQSAGSMGEIPSPTSDPRDDEVVQAAQDLASGALYNGIARRMQAVVRRYGSTTNAAALAQAADLMAMTELIGPPRAMDAHVALLRAKSSKALFLDNDRAAALRYDMERLARYEDDPIIRRERFSSYVNLVHGVGIRYVLTGRIDEARELRDRMRRAWDADAKRLTPHVRGELAGTVLNLELFIAVNTLAIEETLPMLPQLVQWLEEHESHGPTEVGIGCRLNIALLLGVAGRFREAVQHLNIAVQYPESLRADVHTAARLYRIVAHYEQGHDGLVESLVRSERRRREKETSVRGDDVELLLTTMAKLITLAPSSRLRVIRKAHARIEELYQAGPDKNVTTLFDWGSWLAAHIERTSWRTCLSRRLGI